MADPTEKQLEAVAKVIEMVALRLEAIAMESHRGQMERHHILCCVEWVRDMYREEE